LEYPPPPPPPPPQYTYFMTGPLDLSFLVNVDMLCTDLLVTTRPISFPEPAILGKEREALG
jgi:hypothetical protein